MPKKNKAPTNGFYYFMMDFKGRQGRKFNNMQEVSAAAGEFWSRMNEAERKPYNMKASKMKESNKQGKLTSLSEDIDKLKKEEDDEKRYEDNMKKNIEKTVRQNISANTIHKLYFHIMHINNFCYATKENRHYPAEIALSRFNLEEGVLPDAIYHEIVRPGALPLGYSFRAKQTSNETHQLPPPIGESDCNLQEITDAIFNFMSNSGADDIPPIYVSDKNMKMVKEVLLQLCNDYDYDSSFFQVYSLEHLLFVLKNNVGDSTVWPTISQSILELEKDVYDYSDGISCGFHEETDVVVHCSKSVVTRLAFIICDNCCPIMGIQMIPGQHIPIKGNLNAYFDNASTNNSFYSCKRAPSVAGSVTSTSCTNAGFISVASQDEDDEDDDDDGWQQASRAKKASSVSSSTHIPLRRPITQSLSLSGGSSLGHNSFIGRGRARSNQKY